VPADFFIFASARPVRSAAAWRGVAAALVLAGLLTDALHAQSAPAHRYVATQLLDFELDGENTLFMPTAVTVAPNGSVFVVDGVNDRVVEFGPDGGLLGEIRAIGDQQLSQPMNARIDQQGRLWIVDSGNHRVLLRAPDGRLERVITPPQGVASVPPDITDLALSPDGGVLWLADNDHHRLLRFDLETAEMKVIAGLGESLGQLHYPFMLAAARNGDILVTDVFNGRVQIFTADGVPIRSLGGYGVDLGQLYRPKGLGIDADGNVWVADGALNVIQVFAPGRPLLGVLGGTNGELLRFDAPTGLAFDAHGDLYVVELRANRVRKLRVTKTSAAPPVLGPRREHATIGRQARTCTLCHLEWMKPLVDDQPSELIGVPDNPPEHPFVSRSELCLGCHDGSVADSRRRVWIRHGHRIGIEPPPTTTVPEHLPLIDGRIACRTCHSAHGLSEPRPTFEEIVFLRVESSPSELCVQCHANLSAGPLTGAHPLGKMEKPVPPQLIEAGALIDKDQYVLSCLVCHEGHGSQGDLMLVFGTSENELCLVCHEKMHPGMFREHDQPPHPVGPKLTQEQIATVQDAGAKLGSEGELICLSCHRMHNAKSHRYILAFGDLDSEVCLRCHSDKRALAGSSHDLRTNFPDETNIHGTTATKGGPCSPCHLFHNYARPAEAYPIDPRGLCVTCHQPDRCAKAKILGPVNHPKEQCVACHDPHNRRLGKYLADAATKLCASCHKDQAGLVRGPHDVTRDQDQQAWPQAAKDTKDTCLACHRAHGTDQTGLYRVAPDTSVAGADAVCLACHASTKPGADSESAVVHPREVKEPLQQDKLPLVETAGGQHQVACTTCHDSHRSPTDVPHLLRGEHVTTAEELCLTCHPQLASIHTVGEARESLQAAGFTSGGCKPCHVVHAHPQAVESRFLWPKRLSEFERPAALGVSDEYCVACHRAGGPVAPPAIASHPQVLMFNPTQPDAPYYFPLFNADGEVDPRGGVACRTCHLPHGRASPAPVPEYLRNISARELRARKWHIRTFGATTVCNTCHGVDALRRFMYFHDPARRSGPIEGGAGRPSP
jgi:predicted CXXCH cytochrome family protein